MQFTSVLSTDTYQWAGLKFRCVGIGLYESCIYTHVIANTGILSCGNVWILISYFQTLLCAQTF